MSRPRHYPLIPSARRTHSCTHARAHIHLYASCSQPAPCEKVLICILLLTWRDTVRERERETERVCVNQCNGARTSVALKREQTCGGQDMIFFFLSWREAAIQHICHCQPHNWSYSQTDIETWTERKRIKAMEKNKSGQSSNLTTLDQQTLTFSLCFPDSLWILFHCY